LIGHTDSHLDAAGLENFVRAYQKTATLTSGELWAIPIMLRFGLVENLRRLIDEALQVFHEREEANEWADRLLQLCQRPATELLVALADLTRAHEQLEPAFTLRLT
jgi:Ser/Thr protein kinase RdoA (MazF antagonist)